MAGAAMIKIRGQNNNSKSTAISLSHPHPSMNEKSQVHAKNLALISSKSTRSV